MWSGRATPGQSTERSGKSGSSTVIGSRPNQKGEPVGLASADGSAAGDQWWQAPGLPADSAVRKLLPQPQPETALGLLTVKPAPMSVSR